MQREQLERPSGDAVDTCHTGNQPAREFSYDFRCGGSMVLHARTHGVALFTTGTMMC